MPGADGGGNPAVRGSVTISEEGGGGGRDSEAVSNAANQARPDGSSSPAEAAAKFPTTASASASKPAVAAGDDIKARTSAAATFTSSTTLGSDGAAAAVSTAWSGTNLNPNGTDGGVEVASEHGTTTIAKDPEGEAEKYEHEHVHSVYESIASHFSSTRYKPWPFVATFLESLAPGSVGLDVGCGNGKYINVNRDVFIMGSDRSSALVQLARAYGCDVGKGRGGNEAMVADGLSLPFSSAHRVVDFVICIAVIHHLSTRERRQDGIRQLLECVQAEDESKGVEGGKVLVYVWALEQRGSRRGWDEGEDQDQLVPWVMKAKTKQVKKSQQQAKHSVGGTRDTVTEQSEEDQQLKSGSENVDDTTYQRYYHLYKKGELEEDVAAAGGRVVSSGYEKDNWWAISTRCKTDR